MTAVSVQIELSQQQLLAVVEQMPEAELRHFVQEVSEICDRRKIPVIQSPIISQPLSLSTIAKLPVKERNQILAAYVPKMAEDFQNDPELTEFSVLDSEDWES